MEVNEKLPPSIDIEAPFQGIVIAHAAVYGGMMANFGRHFAKRLVEEGVRLHFFASRYPIFGSLPPVEDLESIGGQFHGLPLPQHFAPLHDLWTFILIVWKLRRLKVQVIHTRGTVIGVIGRLAAKLANVPIIINHQDDLHYRDPGLSSRAKSIVALLESRLARLTDQSLFVSEAVLKDALAIGFPPDRCTLVGHDLNEVFQKAANSRDQTREPVLSRLIELGIPQEAQIVGYIGRLTHYKGADLFLEAAALLAPKFPNWVFVIKGDGPMHDEIQLAIHQRELSDRIFLFTDELPAEWLPALYHCFDVFSLPTRREGFGMVFAEAMAMGIPVVAPRIAPVTEVVPEECGVLVESENVEILVQALATLMNDRQLRSQLAESAQEYAIAEWCSQQAANRVLDVYQDLLVNKLTSSGRVSSEL